MIISVIGGYDREQLQSFLNIVLRIGVNEVRILKIGQDTFLDYTIKMLKLAHDCENLFLVDFEELITKDGGQPANVLLFMNSSFDSLEEFTKMNFPLVKLVFEAIKISGVEAIKIVLGDNNRGLMQHAYFLQLLKNDPAADENKVKLDIVTVSSIHQMSKSCNSAMGERSLRMYPKADGETFAYDPTGEITDEEAEDLSMELKDKIKLMEEVFTPDTSSSSYPYIEGRTLGKFMELYLQSQDWELTKRDDGLTSREPSKEEMNVYGLETSWPLFLMNTKDCQREFSHT